MTTKSNAVELLTNLTIALDGAFISSWQSTADWQQQLDRAKEFIRAERVRAAAPDLLEALRAVVRVTDRATDEFDLARAAILKATGEQA